LSLDVDHDSEKLVFPAGIAASHDGLEGAVLSTGECDAPVASGCCGQGAVDPVALARFEWLPAAS
jgi:hypothetical protein